MNGYQLQAESYKKYLESNPNEINKENIRRIIKVNEFLATCTKEDVYELYNTGAFNDITKAYCKKAMQNIKMSHEQITSTMEELRWLHDTVEAEIIATN